MSEAAALEDRAREGFPKPLARAITVQEAAGLVPRLPSEIVGDADRLVNGVGALDVAAADTIAFCNRMGDKADAMIADSAAGALVIGRKAEPKDSTRSYILTDDPKHWYVMLLNALFPDSVEQPPAPDGTTDGHDGRFPGVTIGLGCVIHPDVEIGAGTTIANNVTLYGGTRIGRDCHVMDGCVIGGNGISFTKDPSGDWATFPHLGRVLIGDRVRVGQNSVIQRGLLRNTVLSDDVKTGALVNIAHNCLIGRRSWVSAGVTFCGSVRTGTDIFIGAGAILNNHILLDDRCKVASAAFVVRNVPADGNALGSPAKLVPFLSRF